MEETPVCPYCAILMQPLGFIEGVDLLGVFVAETFLCSQCGYRLERHPVYIDYEDDLPDSAPLP